MEVQNDPIVGILGSVDGELYFFAFMEDLFFESGK